MLIVFATSSSSLFASLRLWKTLKTKGISSPWHTCLLQSPDVLSTALADEGEPLAGVGIFVLAK